MKDRLIDSREREREREREILHLVISYITMVHRLETCLTIKVMHEFVASVLQCRLFLAFLWILESLHLLPRKFFEKERERRGGGGGMETEEMAREKELLCTWCTEYSQHSTTDTNLKENPWDLYLLCCVGCILCIIFTSHTALTDCTQQFPWSLVRNYELEEWQD